MILSRLSLSNFRNYKSLELSLSAGINLISGNNAQGKTNLLEAIYYLGTLKSFRVRSETELVNWGQPAAGVQAGFIRADGTASQLEVRWAQGSAGKWERRVKRNGIVLRSLAEFLKEVPLSLFIPQDLALVQGGPEARRRYLNVLLCKSSPDYLRALMRYQQVLRQRNEWWKRRSLSRRWDELKVWDEQLAWLSAQLVRERERAAVQLNSIVNEVFAALSETTAALQMRYRTDLTASAEANLDKICAKREDEIARQQTLLGPHRDDLIMTMDGRSLKQCASQGQHRSAALAMRLAEALYIGRAISNPAIILLDDCFSELDQGRCSRLFDYLSGLGQIIITSANRFDYKGNTPIAEYFVSNGVILTDAQVWRS
ncbi:DNA replication/repair protein RecF [bacterium]|nr:DNA replication/repair protein RecF [bacterium]